MTFSVWLRHMWELHCAEVENWEGHSPNYDAPVYFHRYRWWLRREYQAQNPKIAQIDE